MLDFFLNFWYNKIRNIERGSLTMARLLVLNDGELSQEITSFSENLNRLDENGELELRFCASVTTEDAPSLNSALLLKFAPYFAEQSVSKIAVTDDSGRVLSETTVYDKVEAVSLQGDENQEFASINIDFILKVE